MSALQRMLGLDQIDFNAIGESVKAGVDGYNLKLDQILAELSAIKAQQAQMINQNVHILTELEYMRANV